MRSRCLPAILLALVVASLAPAQAAPVAVDGGSLEGITLASGIRAWLGVPFAAPPVRELRWRAPQPVIPWQGVRHAERAAPMCLQALRSRTMNHYFGDEATSEDCLYLNIWAPASGTRLPVIVWVYGGGFNVGSASMANYSGEGLAREGVVRVNLAYRVGPLGFLAHPELTRESGYGGSGNYGLMDQIAALRWVQRNIARFGGDPGNVTIAGQSAGSTSVALLQASPAAAGLFHRVVGMSGSPFAPPMQPVPLAQGESEGLALQRALGARSIEEMRDIAGDRILAADSPRSAIVIDGQVLPASPEELFGKHLQNDVAVMMGFTRDESFLPLGAVGSAAEYTAAIRRTFPANAEQVLAAYPAQDSATARRAAADVARDASVGVEMWQWAAAQKTHGKQPAWVYFFTRRQPYAAGIRFSDHDPATAGAYHSGEIPYFLRTRGSLNLFRQTRDWSAVDDEIERIMSGLLLEFVRTGTPRAPGTSAWPAFDPGNPRVLQLGETPTLIDWPNHRALPLLRSAVFHQAPAPAGRVRD
jgi:para-nitrobenzyl esterase